MTNTIAATLARLSYRLRHGVLMGSVDGKNVHSVTRRHAGIGPAPGLYRLHPPTQHRLFGRVARADPVADNQFFVTMSPMAMLENMVDHSYGWLAGAQGNNTWDADTTLGSLDPDGNDVPIKPVWPRAITASCGNNLHTRHSFLILRGTHGGINDVVVLSGFEELMDSLASTGGAWLEVVSG